MDGNRFATEAKVKEAVTLPAADIGDPFIWCWVTGLGVMVGKNFLTGNTDYGKV
jgi:hypothetical protein